MTYRTYQLRDPQGWVPSRTSVIVPPPPPGNGTATIQLGQQSILAGDLVPVTMIPSGATVTAVAWTATAGTFANPAAATTTWAAPTTAQTVTISVRVGFNTGPDATATALVVVAPVVVGPNPFASYWAGRSPIPRLINWRNTGQDMLDWTALDPAAPRINGSNPTAPRAASGQTDWTEGNATTSVTIAGLGVVPIIENYDFTSAPSFDAGPNATSFLGVRNCTFPGNGGTFGAQARASSAAARRGGTVLFIDCDLRAGATNGIVFSNWYAIRCRVQGATAGGQDLGRINGKCYIEGCTYYNHLRRAGGGVHGDVVQAQSGNGTIIRDSWFRAGDDTDFMNTCVACYADTGPISNVLVEDCYVNGGNYSIAADPKTNSITNIKANRVIFGGFNNFGPSNGFTLSNCYLTTGTPVT